MLGNLLFPPVSSATPPAVTPPNNGLQGRPEPMNASFVHSKVKITLTLSDPVFLAGTHVTGKMELECKADVGLGIGVLGVELRAIQELTSRDHSATSTFLHTTRLFQGPGLPPSNAVLPHPLFPPASSSPSDLIPLPPHYHQARRGLTTFLFKIPLPRSSPASINFGGGLACVRYEVRATVGVAWKGDKRLVVDKKAVEVAEACHGARTGIFTESDDDIGGEYGDDGVYREFDYEREEPVVVVGEGGKIWAQAKVVGSVIVAGESACVELQIKNHSTKKTTGVQVTLNRSLHLPSASSSSARKQPPLAITDTLLTTSYRGPEYNVPPGVEGVASLVFDIPKGAKGVRGGLRTGGEDEEIKGHIRKKKTECLFEVRCVVRVKITLPIGSKDILLELPVKILHPLAIPQFPASIPDSPSPYNNHTPPYAGRARSPNTPGLGHPHPQNAHSSAPYVMSPPLPQQQQQNIYTPPYPYDPAQQQWLAQGRNHIPNPHQYFSPPIPAPGQHPQFYFPPPPHQLPLSPPPLLIHQAHHHGQNTQYTYMNVSPHRPMSVGPMTSLVDPVHETLAGLPAQGDRNGIYDLQHEQDHLDQIACQELVQEQYFDPNATYGDQTYHNPDMQPADGEEGKGARASRFTQHLRLTSRHRSVSPRSHRFPVPVPIPVPSVKVANIPGLAQTPPNSEAIEVPLHSPRPLLSPKHSYTVDPVTKHSLSKSDRVEELERMAADTDANERAAELNEDHSSQEKTLPRPPVPSGKNLLPYPAGLAANRPRVDQLFSSNQRNPLTPTLTAVTPVRLPRTFLVPSNNLSLDNVSGLDALERRLLAEVGTRKVEKQGDKHADVRDVLPSASAPIAIMGPAPEPLNDSAISSLTLADHLNEAEREPEREPEPEQDRDSDGKTHQPGRFDLSEDDRDVDVPVRRRNGSAVKTGSGTAHSKGKDKDAGETRLGKKREKERLKEDEAYRIRKSAKGRVAAWLGGVDPDIPPEAVASPLLLPTAVDTPAVAPAGPTDDVQAVTVDFQMNTFVTPAVLEKADAAVTVDEATMPNPRSSGFVPLGTLKKDEYSVINASPHTAEGTTITPVVSKIIPVPRIQRAISLPQGNIPETPRAAPTSPIKQAAPPLLRSPAFPPQPVDPEVKYDIRSARGGKGGRVTAVASIWAAQTVDSPGVKPSSPLNQKPAIAPSKTKAVVERPSRPSIAPSSTTPAEPSLADLTARRAKLIKSASIPAVVSSSHATPTLSTTASLVRPTPRVDRRKQPVKVPITISESLLDPAQGVAKPSNSAQTTGDLAFGQARLRDLIKKYQGQTTS